MTTPSFLLICDLDRTVLPNGTEPLSKNALAEFKNLVAGPEITLGYASGRDLGLIEQAIKEFDVPTPSIAIGDVGTSMYFQENEEYHPHEGWNAEIAPDWNRATGSDIHALIKDIKELTPQESEKQNTFKQSYYTPPDIKKEPLIKTIQKRLTRKGIRARAVFSVDQIKNTGLLDIIPESATKRHAIRYLARFFPLEHDQIVFAGDSGNDIDALISGYNAIVVNNARQQIKNEVRRRAKKNNTEKHIYFARGGYKEMNGNYVAGILEGLEYFAKRNAITLTL